MIDKLVIDTTVLVGFVDERDKFHAVATSLASRIQNQQIGELYFDCVLVEAIGVLCRRSEEQRRSEQLHTLLNLLEQKISIEHITIISDKIVGIYPDVMQLVRQTQGRLNFNDALIAVACRQLGTTAIASFDQDFDLIPWLKRIARPEDLEAA